MINFTVGPVQMDKEILEVSSRQIPYFRTEEFSNIMLENEMLIKRFSKAPNTSKVIFLTGSGTAAMEAAVMNCLTTSDHVLTVNGGTFGQRFVDLCKLHKIPHSEILLEYGTVLTEDKLIPYEKAGEEKTYTGFLVNIHETSTGVLYDLKLISDFCKRNHLFLIVDAISSFLADDIDVSRYGIDVLLIGSQKALALAPGIAGLILSERAIERIHKAVMPCLYLNLELALKDAARGQTPFTPAVGTLLQLNCRLQQIARAGVDNEIARVAAQAKDFREKIKGLPIHFFSESMSNAATALKTENISAYKIFEILKDQYHIWVCPNGGNLKDKVFRVGHMGALTPPDNKVLVDALADLYQKSNIQS